ncbi:MAG: 2,3-bisphosphoglycerate-independent phosphoglycerate mutase [Candidatus Bathyarchaeota archaeon]|nr:2,3-bisphosphoglycerate-independent phosphoglycerate mutase [Candidatus Termiticorpusculum sp.]
MRGILIVGDGMADRPLQELGFKTPIEAANAQAMNRLAYRGALGLLDPIAPGVVPGSDAANLALLGYDPGLACGGRGSFEAVGVGLDVREGDLAFRCNFVAVDDDLCLVDERAGRVCDVDAKVLGECVGQVRLKVHSDVELFFKQSLGFKAALVLRGEGLSSNVSMSLPSVGGLAAAVRPLDDSFEAKRTAGVLNEFVELSNQVLNVHPVNVRRRVANLMPANAVLPWGGGSCGLPGLVSFGVKYGLSASCVAAVGLVKGIGLLCGMDVVDVLGATGERDTDTLAKAEAVLSAFRGGRDFVYVHVEAADEASHDGDVVGKVGVIKKIDLLLGRILDCVDLSDTVIVLVPDHATSCVSRRHLCDAVPICFAGGNVVSDGVTVFSERSAHMGGLNHIRGIDVMPMLLRYMGRI